MKRLFLILSALALFSVNAAAYSPLAASDIITRARTYLKDQSTSANRQQFTDATMLQFLSDGQREANAMNWLIQSSFTFTLSAGVTEYAMPDPFMFPLQVWYQQPGQPYTKLNATSFNQLDAQSQGWMAVSGTPLNYYLDYAQGNDVYMGFYPAPISASTGPVIVRYVNNLTDLASDSSSLFNGYLVLQPYASALVYYVVYRCYQVLEEPDLANSYLQYWLSMLQMMRVGMNRQPDFNPPASGGRSP